MISISQDVRKVQKSYFLENVHVYGKHLKQIKKINIPPHLLIVVLIVQFRLMADEEWGEYEKKDWVEEVGEKKMAAVLIG